MINKDLFKYKKEVKNYFGNSKEEMKILKMFFNSVDEYPNISEFNYQELISVFGKPNTVFDTYIKNSSDEILLKTNNTFKTQKKLQKFLIAIIVIIIITAIFSFWKIHNDAKNSYINREVIEIRQE